MLNAMVWIAKSGAPWMDLPEYYGPWKSVYSRFRKWLDCGIIISEGQRSDVKYAIPVLENIDIAGSDVLADQGYDCWELIDYIYENGGEPTIPSKKGAKFKRKCDWWKFKERHLVEKYFLKLKTFRRIATRYDKLASTYLGFIFLASILIWLK